MAKKDKPPSSDNKNSWKKSISKFFTKAPHDRETLIEILRAAENRNLINPDALIMIEGALQVSEMQVRDIMVPRVQMIVVKSDADPQDIHATVVESADCADSERRLKRHAVRLVRILRGEFHDRG